MSDTAAKVKFEVDGQPAQGRRGESLLDALRRAGYEVPSLCHLPPLAPYGACRLCLVEVDRGKRSLLTTSCNYPLEEGLKVRLDTERVQRHRRVVLALLLARAPNAPLLLTLAERYGVEDTSLVPVADAGDCILCGLCARVCEQVVGAQALAWAGRGQGKRLESQPFSEFPERCIGCGACAFVCPTACISMEREKLALLKQNGRLGGRPCRYALMGLLPGALCEKHYDCAACEVDQAMLDRAMGRHPVFLCHEEELG